MSPAIGNALKKIARTLGHYVSGLLRSCWQAGVHALKINGGFAVAAEAKIVPPVDLQFMVTLFAATALLQAIEYFDANPLPDFADIIDPPEPPVAANPPPAAAASPVSAQ